MGLKELGARPDNRINCLSSHRTHIDEELCLKLHAGGESKWIHVVLQKLSMAGMTTQSRQRVLALRVVTSKMLRIEPPLASYLNCGLPVADIEAPEIDGESEYCRPLLPTGGLPSASIICRELVRAVRYCTE